MSDSINVQEFVADLAKYMTERDAITTAYCVVCNPAIYVEVSRLLNPEPSWSSIVSGYKSIALHEWCPRETIYFPQTKAQYDELMASFDLFGQKMRGEVCFWQKCEEPSVHVEHYGSKSMGFCEEHKRQMDSFVTHFKI
jgi:hypothetical protein